MHEYFSALMKGRLEPMPVIALCFSTSIELFTAQFSLLPTSSSAWLTLTSLIAAMLNSAIFQEASDWSSVAVWMPPGKKVDNPFTMLQTGIVQALLKLGFSGIKKMLWDYQGQTEKLKAKELGGQKFWYLFFIATVVEARGQGLASKVVEGWKSVARKDGVPIWLEATTEHSQKIYAKCGFKVVGEVVLGNGTHAASGIEEKGGPGVKAWGMVWKPEKEAGVTDSA